MLVQRSGVKSTLLLLLLLSGAPAHAEQSKSQWFDRKAEGWFWYQKNEEPEEQEPLEPAIPPTPQVSESFQPSGPKPLSTAWIRDNMKKYLDLAMDDPSPENVRAVLYLQRLARDKASNYTDTVELVTVGDPLLDEINRRSTATYANQKQDKFAGGQRQQLLSLIASQSGIFFFFDESYASNAQAPVIQLLQTTYNFSLVPVSTDGSKLETAAFQNVREDQGHSTLMGITSLPATVLIRADGKFDVVGQGAMSLTDLFRRLIISAKRLDIVTDEDVNKTRPIDNLQQTLTDIQIPEQTTQEKDGVPLPPSFVIEALLQQGGTQ